MSQGDDEEKPHEPSQKKLDDARAKGEVPRSNDLNTAASYGGFILCGSVLGAHAIVSLGGDLSGMLENADFLSKEVFKGGPNPVFGKIILAVLGSVSPWFALPAIAALGSIIAQKSFVVALEKLKPKLSRISIISNAKNKFGRSGLFEFAKSFVKLLIFSSVLGIFLFQKTPEIIGTINLEPIQGTVVLVRLCLSFLFIVLAVSVVLSLPDFLWQVAEHKRKNRMSRKELTDEAKQSEGDPQMKQQRRQRGYEIAVNQMLADIPQSDVIVVNPEHYAVALKWSRNPGSAPVCVAKGVDEIAARIREAAIEAGIPIHRDPPTTRAIYAVVEIGQEIRSEHYKAVAAAIRFAEAMKLKARKPRFQE